MRSMQSQLVCLRSEQRMPPPASGIIYVSVVKVRERRWRGGTAVKVKGGAIDERLLSSRRVAERLLIKEGLC